MVRACLDHAQEWHRVTLPDSDQVADRIWNQLSAKLDGFSPSGHSGQLSIEGKRDEIVYTKPDVIETDGTVFQRATHPLLFQVVDRLVDDAQVRGLSVRKLAALTGVSKSWCAVAARYWKETYP